MLLLSSPVCSCTRTSGLFTIQEWRFFRALFTKPWPNRLSHKCPLDAQAISYACLPRPRCAFRMAATAVSASSRSTVRSMVGDSTLASPPGAASSSTSSAPSAPSPPSSAAARRSAAARSTAWPRQHRLHTARLAARPARMFTTSTCRAAAAASFSDSKGTSEDSFWLGCAAGLLCACQGTPALLPAPSHLFPPPSNPPLS